MKDIYQIRTCPVCPEESVIQGEKYRISILTPWLFRLEYSEEGKFEDRPTQCVQNRCFPIAEYQIFDTEHSLKIVTEGIQMIGSKGNGQDFGYGGRRCGTGTRRNLQKRLCCTG